MKSRFLDKFDMLTLVVVVFIVTIGLIAIYSATFSNESGADYFYKQLYFALIGLVVMVAISYLPPRYLSNISYVIYIISLVLLALVLVLGKKISGSRSWFSIAGFGIQPSEFAKIATILALSKFLSSEDKERNIHKPLDFLKACAIVLIPFALIVVQPDLGTSIVFLSFLLPVLFWAGLSPFVLFVFISPIVIAILSLFLGDYYFYAALVLVLIILISFKRKIYLLIIVFLINVGAGISVDKLFAKLQPYQQNRIMALFDPTSDPLGSGYNVIQAKVAIGSGGLTGKGFLQGTQTQLKFIPEQWTDFIYCMIGEEFGFMGAAVLIILYVILILQLINNAYISKNNFLSLSCIGIASILLFHLVVNVGMTIGIMPVVGIPLPLVSYGVSSLLSFMIMVGIGMSTYRNRKIYT
jgi:rod shape determining protein RodA